MAEAGRGRSRRDATVREGKRLRLRRAPVVGRQESPSANCAFLVGEAKEIRASLAAALETVLAARAALETYGG